MSLFNYGVTPLVSKNKTIKTLNIVLFILIIVLIIFAYINSNQMQNYFSETTKEMKSYNVGFDFSGQLNNYMLGFFIILGISLISTIYYYLKGWLYRSLELEIGYILFLGFLIYFEYTLDLSFFNSIWFYIILIIAVGIELFIGWKQKQEINKSQSVPEVL